DKAVGIEGADQRLHGLQAHQDVLEAHQAVEGLLRRRRRALAGAWIERHAAGDHRVRGRDVVGRDYVRLAGSHPRASCPALCRASTSFESTASKTWMAGTSPAMTR